MNGRRLDGAPIGQFPIKYEDLKPGDYWQVLTPDGDRPLNVHQVEDRYWPGDDAVFAQNLTGHVFGVIDPAGRYGMLSIHTVRIEDDDTISILPGDGSSNSVLIKGGSSDAPEWHGYIEHGVWNEC